MVNISHLYRYHVWSYDLITEDDFTKTSFMARYTVFARRFLSIGKTTAQSTAHVEFLTRKVTGSDRWKNSATENKMRRGKEDKWNKRRSETDVRIISYASLSDSETTTTNVCVSRVHTGYSARFCECVSDGNETESMEIVAGEKTACLPCDDVLILICFYIISRPAEPIDRIAFACPYVRTRPLPTRRDQTTRR